MQNPFSQSLKLFQHLLFPSHKNNHRSRALHLDFLAVYVVLGLVMSMGVVVAKQYPSVGRVLGYATDVNVGAVYSIVNDVRAENGLGRLAISAKLNNAANAKAQNMFAENYWAHTSPSGKTPWSFIRKAGYNYRIAGENLAEGYDTSGAVVNAWMASTSHRANILRKDFAEVGYAVVNGLLQGRETTLVVQMFGSRKGVNSSQSVRGISNVKGVDSDLEALVVPENSSNPEEIEFLGGTTATIQNQLQNADQNNKPIVNLKTLSRETVYLIIGILLVVLLLDGLVSWKMGLIRLSGNNFAHFVFLGVIFLSLIVGVGGSIL